MIGLYAQLNLYVCIYIYIYIQEGRGRKGKLVLYLMHSVYVNSE